MLVTVSYKFLQVTYKGVSVWTKKICNILTFFIYPFHGENLVLRKTANIPHFLTQLLHGDTRINVRDHYLPGRERHNTSMQLSIWLTKKYVSTSNYKYIICSQLHRLMAGRRNMNNTQPQKIQNYPILHSYGIYSHCSDNCQLPP